MRARISHPDRPDLSRLVGRLGRQARAYLDTSLGFPTHRAVTPKIIRRLKRLLRQPDPAVRARALAKLARRIVPREPRCPRGLVR